MKDVNVYFSAAENGKLGAAWFGDNTIELSNELIGKEDELLDVLTHEVQHMIQGQEGFTRGASPEFWQSVLDNDMYRGTEYDRNREQETYRNYLEERQKNPELVRKLETFWKMTRQKRNQAWGNKLGYAGEDRRRSSGMAGIRRKKGYTGGTVPG